MDGSVSVSQAERARIQTSRSFANRAANEAHTQSELFEQLLSLNFTVQPPQEKPAAPAESSSTSSDDFQCDCQDKDAVPVEEERDEELSQSTLTALMPASAVEKQKTIEPESNGAEDVESLKPNPETKLCDLPKASDEAIKPVVVEATAESDGVVKVEAPEAVTEAEVTRATDDSTKTIEAATFEEGDLVRRRGKENSSTDSNAAATGPVEQIVVSTVNAKEYATEVAKPDESHAAQSEVAPQNAVEEKKNQTGDERRGDRREKWFERDAASVTPSGNEAAQDQSLAQPTSEQPEPVPAFAATDSQLPTALTADAAQPPVELPGAVSATSPTTPVAVPVSLVTAMQASSIASSSGSATTGAETNQLGPVAPTRSVGTQAAKADSKVKTESSEISQQERVRVIQRIARSFNRISAEGGTINLRLHPEHLGSVTVQVKLEGRSMAARLTTETTAARDAIMADLPALRQRLADQGFDVTKFQVDVAGNGADATFAQTNSDSQSRQYENRSSGSQTDYRRLAANRESRMAFNRQVPLVSAATTLTGAGIDLQV